MSAEHKVLTAVTKQDPKLLHNNVACGMYPEHCSFYVCSKLWADISNALPLRKECTVLYCEEENKTKTQKRKPGADKKHCKEQERKERRRPKN